MGQSEKALLAQNEVERPPESAKSSPRNLLAFYKMMNITFYYTHVEASRNSLEFSFFTQPPNMIRVGHFLLKE